MKKTTLLILVLVVGTFLAACSGNGNKFDAKVEQEKATKVMNGVLTSFKDEEKLAEANTSDKANIISWNKIEEKNKSAISRDLAKNEQRKLLYLLTFNRSENLNGRNQSNILFTHNTKIKNTSFNKAKQTFTFDVERSGFTHKLITLEKQKDTWKIAKIVDPE
ncbi:hypothetical protein NDK43_22785 [Neobacillus pocheonensis]|uniref:DUF4829 domain-containing protein n=1 Tax=Neobacillus pocheonensis TaxID=363869 RepID=A0ABT0WEB3_9BACI|nr:hypothetical protein [Neobacillus pocheonensis]